MRFINTEAVPKPLLDYLIATDYARGDWKYSVSDLATPPQIVHLTRRHWDEIEVDVLDRFWAVLGTAVHHLLSATNTEGSLKEERLFTNVRGVRVSGKFDHYADFLVDDWKVTSVWSAIYGSRLVDWQERLNMYALLLDNNGFRVDGIRVVAIYRDWMRRQTVRRDYPQRPIETVRLPLWLPSMQAQHIVGAVETLEREEQCPDDTLLPCGPINAWERPTTWAVIKEGVKRARAVKPTEEAANAFRSQQKAADIPKLAVVRRPGERVRCKSYCDAAPFCHEYAQWRHENGVIDEREQEVDDGTEG